MEGKKLMVLVLYKLEILDSETFISLVKSNDKLRNVDKLCIWDNTPGERYLSNDAHLTLIKLNCNFEYIHTPENISLAKVYNQTLKKNEGFDWFILLDQDSGFDYTYFTAFDNALKNYPDIKLVVPLIKSNSFIVSPGRFTSFKGKYWTNENYGLTSTKSNTAIASGMIISIDVFDKVGFFDESLVLYGIDNNFMFRFRKCYEYFYVMDVRFIHDLSDHNFENTETKLRRFRDQRMSSIINSKLFPYPVQLLTKFFYLYKSFEYAVKYRRFSFISLKDLF
jgi:GT2 family glycosyltransferase